MIPCHICGRPAAFASRFCSDDVECHYQGRIRLGISKQMANWWRVRELYPWMDAKRKKAA